MSKIKILQDEVVRKIAAGEVIIRPVSVVKELIENSLDAQAQKILIELKGGGKDLIKVIDDGEGMSREDVRLAIARHATSKITSVDDLLKIRTYGFRGEALASIAAVSRLKIESNNDERFAGTYIFVEGGEIKEIKEISRARGTTVTVETLFFNLPVRRAFLKSDSYELKLIVELITIFAIAYPQLHFTLISEGKELFTLPKTQSYKDRLKLFLEKSTFNGLLEFAYSNPMFSFWGVISRPEVAKNHFEIQQIYFNLRPVKNRVVTKAIYDGYAGRLMGRNPTFVVFFETNPENLDVNIHPTKTEVRFIDEKFLFDFVSEAIKKTLGITNYREIPESVFYQNLINFEENRQLGFWQLHGTYIFAQIPSGYCIIDQHAASERIIYEEILKKDEPVRTQGLLFPVILELSPDEFVVYEEIKDILKNLGIESKAFGNFSIVIETIPVNSNLSKQDLKELFRELTQSDYKTLTYKEELARRIACKGAIKANQVLTQQEIESLINKLFACNDPYFCPHGRPTIIKISREELERKFGR
ncbi:MAG: DNA mismatch repair endonuclease MutL [candidate division WOR-3 bacterium]|nr:DNA mismatch repair endonuclease MutL [candidate division WOR-3 bacterium]MCX7757577.1 DNA mismatch repair endonuclease MutL [candidate division WOR-3 bacterium]MDW7987531.1 DNA mismatch repair endonuclease MutL [candidate division WOR-3 bacterium]